MIKDFKVVGFMPAWKTSKIAKIRMDVFTHIIYSFAYPDDASLDLVIPNLDKALDIIGMAHKEKVKVILSVGGWDDFGTSHKDFMNNALSSEENMDTLIGNIVDASYDLSFDGIDINWGNLGADDSRKDDINKFMAKLSNALKEKDMSLSLSVFGNSIDNNKVVSYELASCQKETIDLVDFVNIINYEKRKGVRKTNTNLKMESELKSEIEVDNNKAVMGIPFFVNVSLMAYQEDIKTAKDTEEMATDLVSCGREIYTMADDDFKAKINWAKNNAIGLNIWEVTQDFQDISMLTSES